MPKERPSENWFELNAEPIDCPHCKAGRANVVRRLPDPTRPNIELRTYSCSQCHALTVQPVHAHLVRRR
jgi:hypothetical protein